MVFPAFFHEIQIKLVAGGDGWFQRARQLGQIQSRDLLQTRYLAKRVVVCEKSRVQNVGHVHQPGIDADFAIFATAFVNT